MKERFFYWMKFYLGFSGKEARGFFVLVPILVVFGVLPTLLRSLKNKNSAATYHHYQLQLDSLDKLNVQLVASPLPTFNPQDTAKLAQKPRNTEHLNRISFSETDSIMLQIVPGIGPGTAGRIIKFRQQLGGFRSKEQLLEVYGLTEETMQGIWDYFEFDAQIFKKIPINSASLEELSAHPYISYGEAKVLLAFRKQHGQFNSSGDLLKIKIFKEEWVQKISPYLEFNRLD